MFKLERLKILQYRNVRPGTELRFDDGLNLILGQNASGKTTLLALLSAVCRSAFDAIADEEFELEYELRSDRFTVTAKVMHARAEPSGVDAAFGAGPRWKDSYDVVIEDRQEQTKVVVVSSPPYQAGTARGGSTTALDATVSSVSLIMDWSFLGAAISVLGGEWTPTGIGLMEAYANAFRFDESLDCFSAMTGRANVLTVPARPPVALAKLVIRSNARGYTRAATSAYVPRLLGSALQWAFESAGPGPKALGLGGAERDLCEKLARMLDVSGVSFTPNVIEHRIANGDRSFRVEGFTFEINRADGTIVHHDRLSYGQKRLLAFAYYLECNPHVVIADELVNGLHHRWIDACMEAMAGRQAFLTSQNPLLFDYVDFDSVEHVQSSFITCTLELVDGREQLVWQNMSSQDATVFFEAYEVGIEHVGDILITRGLW